MKAFLASVLSVLILLGAWPARSSELEQPAPGEPAYLGHWPDYNMSLGLSYAPAPEVYGYRDGARVTEKLLDQGVLSLAMDWRPRQYALYGFFFESAFSRGVFILDTGPRIGAQFPVADRWALYLFGSLGFSLARFNDNSPILKPDYMPIRRNYFGGRAGLALGARYRVNRASGLFFEISGCLHALDDGPGGLKQREFNEPYMARLLVSAGFVFGFGDSE